MEWERSCAFNRQNYLGNFKEEIREAVGPLQVCAGHSAGSEAAIYAMNQVFNEEGADGVL